jgi:hypothetical protein
MKEIQSIITWVNGQSVIGTILQSYSNILILGESATFFYAIFDSSMNTVAQGSLLMTGEAYQDWTVDSYAWDWIAEQLNLTIIGDYIPPIIETPSSEIITE